jgi:hypothetical protein
VAEWRCDALGAQTFGSVLHMDKGTALFDEVAISGTKALVRLGWGGDASRAGFAVAVDVGGRG